MGRRVSIIGVVLAAGACTSAYGEAPADVPPPSIPDDPPPSIAVEAGHDDAASDSASGEDAPPPDAAADAPGAVEGPDASRCRSPVAEGFEVDPFTAWISSVANGGSVGRSTTQRHAGAASGLFDVNTATASAFLARPISSACPIRVSAWIWADPSSVLDQATFFELRDSVAGTFIKVYSVDVGILTIFDGTSGPGTASGFSVSAWHHVVLDYEPGRASLRIDGNAALVRTTRQVIPNELRIGIVSVADTGPTPTSSHDRIFFDDVTIE